MPCVSLIFKNVAYGSVWQQLVILIRPFSLFRLWIPLQTRKQYLASQCWTWKQLHFLEEQYLCMFSHTLSSCLEFWGLFSFPFKSWGLISHPVGLCNTWSSGSSSPSWNAPRLGYFLVSFGDSSSACVFECKCSSGFAFPHLGSVACTSWHCCFPSRLDSHTYLNTNISRLRLHFPRTC